MPKTGKQPCSNYKSFEEGLFGDIPHECYRCFGTVYFCGNCRKDHHVGGYETCNVKVRCIDEPFYRDKEKSGSG